MEIGSFGDDLIDEHLFDLNGLNMDNSGNGWAYPFSQSVVPHRWIRKEEVGTYYSNSHSKYVALKHGNKVAL